MDISPHHIEQGKGFPGYKEYKQRVKYKVIPYIW